VASRPKFWPRPRGFDLGLVSISLSYYVIRYFSCQNRVKFGNFVNFPAIILNHMLLVIIWYFFITIFGLGIGLDIIVLPRPRPRSSGLGLGLVALASASASRFWPRLTSLVTLTKVTRKFLTIAGLYGVA